MLDINFPLSTKNEGSRSVLIVAMLDINSGITNGVLRVTSINCSYVRYKLTRLSTVFGCNI